MQDYHLEGTRMTDEQNPSLDVPPEMLVGQMQMQLAQALTEIAALRSLLMLRDAEIARLNEVGPDAPAE